MTTAADADALRRHYAALVESSDDAIISKDLNGTIQSWNRGAERIFGYTAVEVIGKPITILMPVGRKDEESEILAQIRQGHRVDHYETVRQRKDGSLVDISVTVSPIRDGTGKVMGASKIARDISERKYAEAAIQSAKMELAKANQELEQRVTERTASLHEVITQMEEFSYSVSHDLRGPLRAMQGYARAAVEDYGERLDERGRDYLQKIISGSNRMDRLIQDVLLYSRLARTQLQMHPVDLDAFVREVIEQYPEMQGPRAQILIRSPLLPVLAHESSLMQVISNLLVNGVKFVSPGTIPRIDLATERRGANVRLWIKDNGIGIKPQHQPRLFGMFERVTQDHRYEGTGIGLAIVRKAAEKMGGSVGLESDGVHGSSFWIELPSPEPPGTRS
jgi:PAS domain S-box-containing protein